MSLGSREILVTRPTSAIIQALALVAVLLPFFAWRRTRRSDAAAPA